MRKTISLFLAFAVLCTLLWGCRASEDEQPENTYTLYYTTADRCSLIAEEQQIEGEDTQVVAFNMLEAMRMPATVGNASLFVTDGLLKRVYQDSDNIMSVYMSEEYSKLKVSDEVLLRAGIVLALTQLENIDYVVIYVNGEPLADALGNIVGVMSANSFLDSKSENLNNYQQVTVTVYFSDATGEKLVATERNTTISTSISKERQVVTALLEGPEDNSLLPTMPAGTSLISVTVKNNICYVNLSADFLTGDLKISPYATIYSLVNSLTALSNISKVQIMIDGSSSVKFRSMIPLDAPFERNLDYNVSGGK